MSIKDLNPWEVIDYFWGVVVKHRKGNVSNVILKPNGIEIDCSELDVIIHENGIEFLRE